MTILDTAKVERLKAKLLGVLKHDGGEMSQARLLREVERQGGEFGYVSVPLAMRAFVELRHDESVVGRWEHAVWSLSGDPVEGAAWRRLYRLPEEPG